MPLDPKIKRRAAELKLGPHAYTWARIRELLAKQFPGQRIPAEITMARWSRDPGDEVWTGVAEALAAEYCGQELPSERSLGGMLQLVDIYRATRTRLLKKDDPSPADMARTKQLFEESERLKREADPDNVFTTLRRFGAWIQDHHDPETAAARIDELIAFARDDCEAFGEWLAPK